MRRYPRPLVLLAGGATILIAIWVGQGIAHRRSVGPVLPAPTASAGAPERKTSDRLVLWDRARQFLVLADARGTRESEFGVGSVSQVPVLDPTGRHVAYWKTTGGAASEHRLVVWTAGTSNSFELASSGTLIPWGTLVWSSDGEKLAYALGSAPTGPDTPPVHAQLVVAGLRGGARVVSELRNAFPIVPTSLSSDGTILTGTQVAEGMPRYVVVATSSGSITSTNAAELLREHGTDGQGVSWGVIKTFESTRPAVLRVWVTTDYTREIARVETDEIAGPVLWRDRRQVVFGTGHATGGPYRLESVDLADGRVRVLLTLPAPVAPVGFTTEGGYLLVVASPSNDLILVPVATDRLVEPTLSVKLDFPAPAITPIGFTRKD